MLGQMLKTLHGTRVGGNIGRSLLADLPDIGRDDVVVLELSSYMLHYLGERRWSPHVGLITMIADDHLKWHGSRESYVAAKANLVRFQAPGDWAVLNELDGRTPAIERLTAARVKKYGADGRRPFQLAVPGAHNQINAQAAFAAASVFGVEWEQAQESVRGFKGLPHRLELVHEDGGVRYFNDSIATIPEAAVAALEAFPPRTVIQIVGGDDKGLDMTQMFDALSGRAKAVLCVGRTGPAAAAAVRDRRGAPAQDCGNLATAVRRAREIAAPGDVVLLSPGYASYDQFVNFEKRGEAFATLVRERGR
jgi:UDP-N-acetylmuramoylalanine--D-glutamate ligase